MTATTAPAPATYPLARFFGLLRDLIVGTLLCTTPVTSVIALGWLTRRMGWAIDRRWQRETAKPGWILGPRGQGRTARLLGGLGANIRTGVLTGAGLALLTLPFTLPWLGAWWAGWENSFNKGYEQADVGPVVWLAATAIALPILAHLPLALAHAASEARFGAFFEIRRIRSVAAASGWRLTWLAVLSALFCIPLFGMRAIPVFIEDIVPGFHAMGPEAQGQIAGLFTLGTAALAFTGLLFLRHRAAAIYARATPRAARGRQGRALDRPPGAGSPDVRPSGGAHLPRPLAPPRLPDLVRHARAHRHGPVHELRAGTLDHPPAHPFALDGVTLSLPRTDILDRPELYPAPPDLADMRPVEGALGHRRGL